MALIAGILTPPHALDRAALESKVRSYPLFLGKPISLRVVELPDHRGLLLAVGVQDAPVQPTMVVTEHASLLTMGYFRHRQDTGLTHRTLVDHVLSGRVQPNPETLVHLEGEFVALLHEPGRPGVHMVNDRFGARPAFVLQGHQTVLFGTDLAFLTHLHGQPLDLDPLGVFQLFALEHTVGARTHLRGVSKLVPGSHTELELERVQTTPYWSLRYNVEEDVPERARLTAEAFRAGTAWRQRLWDDEPLTVSLSGGLDSRLVAAGLMHPERCTALTIGRADSREVTVARQVAATLGMPHQVMTLDEVPVSSLLPRLALMTGGLLPLHHPATTLVLNDRVAQTHQLTFGGGPGDVLAGSYVPGAWFLDADVEPALDHYARLRCKDLAHLAQFFLPEVYATVAPQLLASVRESLGQMHGPTAAHRITAWAMAVRQPSFTFLGPSSQADNLMEVSPHLDYAYADWMLTLPAKALYHKNFYRHMLASQFPQMAAIPYANTGQAIDGKADHPGRPGRWLSGGATRLQTALPAEVRQIAMAVGGMAERLVGPKDAYSFFRYLADDRPLVSTLLNSLQSDTALTTLVDVPRALAYIHATQRPALRQEELTARFLGCLAALSPGVR